MRRDSRQESFSSSSSRSSNRRRLKWYHEVPILGSVLRTMKDILGLDDSMRYRFREGYQRIESSHRRHHRKTSSRPGDEYYFYRRGRRGSRSSQARPQPQPQPQQYDGTHKCTRVYYSPGLKPRRESGWGNNIYRDRDRDRDHPAASTWQDESFLEHKHKHKHKHQHQHPTRSSSTSSYTRPRHPNIIERSPGASAGADTGTETGTRRRRVSFADPLETSPHPLRQKRPSIDDHTGSRKRSPRETREGGRLYVRESTTDIDINIRAPRPRSPVTERTPLRSGQRIAIPDSPPRRGSLGSYDYYYDNYTYDGYSDSHEDVQYIPRRESRPYSYSSDVDVEIVERSPKLGHPRISDSERREYLNARSRRIIDEANSRRSSLHKRRDEFEVRRS